MERRLLAMIALYPPAFNLILVPTPKGSMKAYSGRSTTVVYARGREAGMYEAAAVALARSSGATANTSGSSVSTW